MLRSFRRDAVSPGGFAAVVDSRGSGQLAEKFFHAGRGCDQHEAGGLAGGLNLMRRSARDSGEITFADIHRSVSDAEANRSVEDVH